MTAPEVLEVSVTTPDRALAEHIAAVLVGEGLAACVQVAGPIASTYRWQGAVERAEEWALRAKTTRAQLEALAARVAALHPYDLPEVLAFAAVGGGAAYLDWVRRSVAPTSLEPES
jgi:periplasmic divalent cation tolerance protein